MRDSLLKELKEMEASKLSYIEFKRIFIRMHKELIDNYKELSENYNGMKKGNRNYKQEPGRKEGYNF